MVNDNGESILALSEDRPPPKRHKSGVKSWQLQQQENQYSQYYNPEEELECRDTTNIQEQQNSEYRETISPPFYDDRHNHQNIIIRV